MADKKHTYEQLQQIIADLRAEDGCPWDRVQTHESLKTCLIEECYEVIEAIDNKDDENLTEELGDVLLQVLMHSQIAEEEQRFCMEEVVEGLARKLIRRHPHVFGDRQAGTPAEGLQNWEDIKKQEKEGKSTLEKGELESVPKAFPALLRTAKVQKKSEKNYGWHTTVSEECESLGNLLRDINECYASNDNELISHKMEEILFKTCNLSRILGINAENSLTNATETFINKFEGETDKR